MKTGEIKTGSVLIGIKKEVPVIPVGLTYEEKGIRKKVIISIGEKINVSEIYKGKFLETKEKEKNGKICELISEGYIRNEKVIECEKVKVYVYKEKRDEKSKGE